MIRRTYKLAHAVSAMLPTRLLLTLVTAMFLAGCGTTAQRHSTIRDNPVSLTRAQLQAGGLAFITPTTVTGQEEDRQGLALTFASILRQNRPELRCLSLSEALGAINKAGLSDDSERSVTFQAMSEETARNLVERLP